MAAVPVPPGVVSWWTGDGTAADLTGKNNGAMYNGGNFAVGQVGSGFKFDGIDDNMQAPTGSLPTGDADRTIEMWARIDQLLSKETFFASYGAPGIGNQAYSLGALTDGRLFVSTWGTAITGPALQTARWYHIAVTNAGTSFKLYLDGAQVAAGSMAVDTPADSTFWLGRQTMTFLGDTRHLNGMVDEVTVYNRALSGSEIQSISNAGADGKDKTSTFVSANVLKVVEGGAGTTSVASFAINRVGDLSGNVTVNWATSNGTATAPSDFVAASGQVVFLAGESLKTVDITVNGDSTPELNENFNLVLTTTALGYVTTPGQATILDDDVAASVSNATAIEGDTSNKPLGPFVKSGGLIAPYAMIVGTDNALYVTTNGGSSVYRYDAATGAPLPAPGKTGAEFVSPGSGGLQFARDLAFAPDGSLGVVSEGTDAVLRYSLVTGEYLGALVVPGSGGLDRPHGLTFRSGYAYVTSYGADTATPGKDSVLRYDATTGAPAGVSGLPGDAVFIASGSAGLGQPSRIIFGPDGRAYVSSTAIVGTSTTTNSVLRYDATTGAPAGNSGQSGDAVFVSPGSGGLDGPIAMVFRPDGYLYVTGWRSNSVLRYQANSGAFAGAVIQSGSGGLSVATDLLFEPSGNLLVTSGATNEVLRFGPGSLAAFVVTLNHPSATPVTVQYATASGTATSGSDFNPMSDTLTFAPGQTTKTIIVPTVNDTAAEGTESFTVILSSPVGAVFSSGALTINGVGTITDDDATKFYVVNDGSPDRTYEYAPTGAAIENYPVASGNTAPRGAASNVAGDKVWIIDANNNVYVYNTSGGLLGSWSAGSLPSNADVQGITTNGTDIWIVDNKGDKVYRYTGAASRLSGSQTAASSFNLNGSNTNPADLVTDGSSIWVVNNTSTDKVFKYNISGTLLGSWTINSGGGSPTGITIDPSNVSNIWIVDNTTDRVYQFDAAASRTSLSQSPSTSFALSSGNTNPQGIADPPPPSDSVRMPNAVMASPTASGSMAPMANSKASDIAFSQFSGDVVHSRASKPIERDQAESEPSLATLQSRNNLIAFSTQQPMQTATSGNQALSQAKRLTGSTDGIFSHWNTDALKDFDM